MSPNDRFRVRILSALALGLVACGKDPARITPPPSASASELELKPLPVTVKGLDGGIAGCVAAQKNAKAPSTAFADCSATIEGRCCGSAGGSMPCPRAFLEEFTRNERAKGGGSVCCYQHNDRECEGRPLRAEIDGPPIVARSIAKATIGAPRDRRAGERWLRAAANEHASIASFALTSLKLLALGAPPELVADTHRAALDEVEHTRISLEVASALLGERHVMGPLEVPAFDGTSATFATLARETLRDAACSETIAALRAGEEAEREGDPAIRDALLRIAEDEARHAELGWRTVAWLVGAGGQAAHEAVREELERVRSKAEREQVYREIVVPCADALLGAS